MAIRHVVLIRFNDDASSEDRDRICQMYQEIAERCGGVEAGILEFVAKPSIDQRKCHLVEVALFRDREALELFRVHPEHHKLTDLLKTVASWWVGNFETD